MRSEQARGGLISIIGALLLWSPVHAFDVNGGWPNGTIPMRLLLDSSTAKPAIPNGGLIDGNATWNAAVTPTFTAWNPHMARTQFTSTIGNGENGGDGNGINEVFFAEKVYGATFGASVLAVTVTRRAPETGIRIAESDVIFNSAVTWNSYRGNLRFGVSDIQRVALHEFGHAIGLDHPDEAIPLQNVPAIMNSHVSDLYVLQVDDIEGAGHIYSSSLRQPAITKDLQGISVAEAGDGGMLTIEVDGGQPPPQSDMLKYGWNFSPASGANPEVLFTVNEARIPFGAAQLDDAGIYYVSVETPLGATRSSSVSVTVSATAQSTATRLANLSTRGIAGTGDRSLIVGFVVDGSESRRVLVRAAGPTLEAAPFNLAGTVSDPVLELKSGNTTVASNDNWQDDGAGAGLQAAFEQAGAFPLIDGSADAALIATVPPGVYTAVITSKSGAEGLAIVEAYDLDSTSVESNRLVNLSTRGFVGTGDQIMIAGFVVSGTAPRKYILRAAGDTLGSFGVAGFLDDTTLDLYNSSGALLRKTDDKDSPRFLESKLTDAFTAAGAFQLTDRQESAMLLTLNPGAYTLHLAGFEGSTGIALVEIYEVSN